MNELKQHLSSVQNIENSFIQFAETFRKESMVSSRSAGHVLNKEYLHTSFSLFITFRQD